jgi:hypothetical protein
MELSPTMAKSTKAKRRRALALTATALAVVAAVGTFMLGGTGSSSTSIKELPGAKSGAVAQVTELASTVTRTNGAAHLDAGVALDRLLVAEEAANHIQVSTSWTNVQEAAKVLLNPNAQLSVGLYHPIHTGECTVSDNESNKGKEVDAPRVTIEDTNKEKLCGALDEGAKGSASVSETGKLLLSKGLISGYLRPSVNGEKLSACAASGTSWCTPASAGEHQAALYLVTSVVTPGGIPQGEQAQASNLNFYTKVKRLH